MLMRRKVVYIQVHHGYFIGRVHGDTRSIRRECAGLNHPRTLAGNFMEIKESLTGLLKELRTPIMWVLRPYALVHLVPEAEGGYTNIELRAFKEAVEVAGAQMGFLCDDKYSPLSEQQVAEVVGAIT